MPVFEFAPTAIKQSVAGWGGAPKEQVQQMVVVQLGLTDLPGPLDISDALAIALRKAGKLTQSEALYREALKVQRRVLGDEHPTTLNTMNKLGNVIAAQGPLAGT